MKHSINLLFIFLCFLTCCKTVKNDSSKPKWSTTTLVSNSCNDDSLSVQNKVVFANYVNVGHFKNDKGKQDALINMVVTYVKQIDNPIVLIDLYHKGDDATLIDSNTIITMQVVLKNKEVYNYDLGSIEATLVLLGTYDTKEFVYLLQTQRDFVPIKIRIDNGLDVHEFYFKIYTNQFTESYSQLYID